MSGKKIIVVAGSTGAQGGGLARAILADPNGGFAVRALTRDVHSEKAKALSNFIGTSQIFDTLDPAEQERLKEQNDVMWQYSEILGARIAAF